MAGIFSIIGDAAIPYALIGGSSRSIGTIFPHVAVEEVHHDTAVLTQHPVETGSPITDHMFLMPQMVELRWGWSDSTAQATGYVDEVYQELLQLQQSRKPFPISTARRQYDKMQIISLTVKTDGETANSFLPIAVCQQIILVDIQTTQGKATPNTNGSSGVGNTNDTSSASGISATNAKNAGWSMDGNGNVSFPNGVATGGQVNIPGVSTTTTWGGSTIVPPGWADTASKLSAPGV